MYWPQKSKLGIGTIRSAAGEATCVGSRPVISESVRNATSILVVTDVNPGVVLEMRLSRGVGHDPAHSALLVSSDG